MRTWLVDPVVRWHRRNVLYREMMSLDDRTLADLGMSKADVPYFVLTTDVVRDADDRRPINRAASPTSHMADDRLAA